MNHILVVTTEPLPLPGGLTTGAGLRAWGLAEGLRSRGFPVTIATPLEGEQAHTQAAQQPPPEHVQFFQRSELASLVVSVNPDVIVMQHWGLVYALPPHVPCPLVIDLAGPHLLERGYWGNPDPEHDLQEKLAALRQADFVVCGGYYQRHYFYPYLAMAGFDVTRDNFPVIPFSVSPEPLEVAAPTSPEPTFIYGGAFLAWQNPELPIRWLLDEMDRLGRGRLLFYGGSHPTIDASAGRFLNLYKFLKQHSRVEYRGWKPFEQLCQEYASEGHVALDLMERNPERELAYTTRTMVYLYCGLPVIYNNYSELSGLLARNNCGWTLDPTDELAFRSLVRHLLENPGEALKMRNAARAAAAAQSWDKTISPLAEFCSAPSYRTSSLAVSPPEHTEQAHMDTVPAAAFSSQTPISRISRLRRSIFPAPGKILGNLVYFPVRLISRYLYKYLTVSSSARAHKK